MKFHYLSILAVGIATPALAQTQTQISDIAQIKISPLAIEIAAKLFPDGTYRRLFGPNFTQMISSMVDNIGGVPVPEIARAVGADEKAVKALSKVNAVELMAIIDPAFKERQKMMMEATFTAMIPVLETMEPDLRIGLAQSIQSKFTPIQLIELKSFFATPTGASFASQQMFLFSDPAVMGKIQTQMPKIMAAMPDLVGKAIKATENLPKPRKMKDLTAAERAQIFEMFDIRAEKSKK